MCTIKRIWKGDKKNWFVNTNLANKNEQEGIKYIWSRISFRLQFWNILLSEFKWVFSGDENTK